MFLIDEDLSIHLTRGDAVCFSVAAEEDDGTPHEFQVGDRIRFRVCKKKNCGDVVLSKDFPITVQTREVEIFLGPEDTRIGEIISKPKDYWYEVELNPVTAPQTLVGYDGQGPKVFRLYPEGVEGISKKSGGIQ